jgi:hypothetical protein
MPNVGRSTKFRVPAFATKLTVLNPAAGQISPMWRLQAYSPENESKLRASLPEYGAFLAQRGSVCCTPSVTRRWGETGEHSVTVDRQNPDRDQRLGYRLARLQQISIKP